MTGIASPDDRQYTPFLLRIRYGTLLLSIILQKTLTSKIIMFHNVAYWCLFSPITILFIKGFCAGIGTDLNKPATSCNTMLLILKEKYCYNYKIYVLHQMLKY